jgi:hypothetical protein
VSVNIAMWSGPRNISTAMMRAFENRPDTAVIDEPFYAAFLVRSGLGHPMRQEVLAAHEADPAAVMGVLAGEAPGGAAVFYQKQMTHHMLPGFDGPWMDHCRHAFLIRAPERVLASYVRKRAEVSAEDIGFRRQGELFDEIAARTGAPPPVIDADDILAEPRGALTALCAALAIAFEEAMLAWPAGSRASDGAWAPAWYDAVERSTGFAPPPPPAAPLRGALAAIAEEVRPIYERLRRHRIFGVTRESLSSP